MVQQRVMNDSQSIPGRKKYHVLASAFTFLTLISIGSFFYYVRPGDLPSIYGILMMAFFIYLLGFWLYSIHRLRRRQIGVVISPDRIIDMTNVWGITFIQRKAIHEMKLKRVLGQKWLCIYLKDQPFAYHTNLLNRFFLYLVELQTGTPIMISESTIKVPIEELKQKIQLDKKETGAP